MRLAKAGSREGKKSSKKEGAAVGTTSCARSAHKSATSLAPRRRDVGLGLSFVGSFSMEDMGMLFIYILFVVQVR